MVMTELNLQVEHPLQAESAVLPVASGPCCLPASSKRFWLDLLELTKPRMNFLVIVTTMVGFYMAARASSDWLKLPKRLLAPCVMPAQAH